MVNVNRCIILLFCLLAISSCVVLPITRKAKLAKAIRKSSVFAGNFTGFALYDPEKQEVLYAHQDDKYYTPASNTKLLTFYAGLKMLGNQVPALQYWKEGGKLYFTGTGDPSFLHPDLNKKDSTKAKSPAYAWLKNQKDTLVYVERPFSDKRLGPGWAWDDYNSAYSVERSSFPIHGNFVRFNYDSINDRLKVQPAFFSSYLLNDTTRERRIKRELNENYFAYGKLPDSLEQDVPFRTSKVIKLALLNDTLPQRITIYKGKKPDSLYTYYSIPADSIYAPMLKASDNFIAEQILLLCSSVYQDTLSSFWTIEEMKKRYLNNLLPDTVAWYDGSGLSRYNLQTPRNLIRLLQAIREEVNDDERLFSLMAAGGESGTIKNWYAGNNEPYVYAKTGTLRNKHCLSGYIKTDSGNILLFSFMHNNYTFSTSRLKEEMNGVLQLIKDKF